MQNHFVFIAIQNSKNREIPRFDHCIQYNTPCSETSKCTLALHVIRRHYMTIIVGNYKVMMQFLQENCAMHHQWR